MFGPGDDTESHAKAALYAEWWQAIKEELSSLVENRTWEYVNTSDLNGRRTLRCQWVVKTKNNYDGSVQYKARLVIKGYEQTSLGETFVPIA